MALKPTTNKRCPLSAGHTPLEADSHQVSAWSFRRRRFRMVHIESLSRISIYLALCETTELCLVCPVFSANSLGASPLTEVRIIKRVVERPVFGLLNVQSQFLREICVFYCLFQLPYFLLDHCSPSHPVTHELSRLFC